jgi:[ribosomal protein S18]-alanine N-acetyltransferase
MPHNPWTQKRIHDSFVSGTLFWGIRDNRGSLVAYAATLAVDHEAELLKLVVHPDYQCLGLASLLIRHLQRRYPGGLTLEVAADNQPALQLYQNRGFVTLHRRNGYYHSGQDALVMRNR